MDLRVSLVDELLEVIQRNPELEQTSKTVFFHKTTLCTDTQLLQLLFHGLKTKLACLAQLSEAGGETLTLTVQT